MSNRAKTGAFLFTLVLVSALGGCAYYQINDPTTGKTYYTQNAQRAPYSGAVMFVDAKSGDTLTLQNTQIKQISQEEFKNATGK